MGSRQEAGFDSRVILTRTVRPPKTWHPPDTHYNTADTPSSTNCQHARLARGIGHGGVGAVPYPHTPPLIGHRPPRDFIFLRGLGYGVCAASHRHTHDARTPRPELSTRAVGTRYRARRGRGSASSTHTTLHRPSTTTRFNKLFTRPRLWSVRGVAPAHSRCTHPARAETLAHPAGLMASPPTFPAPYTRRASAQRTPRTNRIA